MSSPGRGSSHRSVALLGSLSVVIEYLALRDGPRRFRPGFTCPTLLGYRLGELPTVAYGTLTRSGATFQRTSARGRSSHDHRPHDPGWCPARFRLVPVRSPLLRESRLISFPPGTEMFQFPGSPRVFRVRRSLGSSPGLFAAFHARILMTPRHPPRALRSLTTPTRPPLSLHRERPVAAQVTSHCPVPRPARLATRRTAHSQGNDPLSSASLTRVRTSPPRSVRVHVRGDTLELMPRTRTLALIDLLA